ncbi:hypothetical protein [Elongatibacter sediminis]|uniref:Fibronectin type-III domain-containing protein n=1 Tax=Elongatibacter sediminis TaxID=3119006 RepID=A0AAW9RJG6_9GAMM
MKYAITLLVLLSLMTGACGQESAGRQATELRAAGRQAAETTTAPEPNVITWSTASEHGSFGYDVYRGLSENGPFTAVNAEIIPGAGTTDLTRHYEFVDEDIEPDTTYWYYIESISLTGERKRITPIHPSKPKPTVPAAD